VGHPSHRQNRESFARWQATRQGQLSSVNNLLLAFSSGLMAWEWQALIASTPPHQRCEKLVLLGSVLSLGASAGFGICTAWNRLTDFRVTARIARMEGCKSGSQGDSRPRSRRVSALRGKANRLGRRTWSLLRWQLSTFVLGIITLAWVISLRIFR